MNRNLSFVLLFVILLLVFPFASASHFIVGIVNDAQDTTSANGMTVTLWNPSIGQQDNVTDIIGVGGNSGSNNVYLIDCELLQGSCDVNDILSLRVFDYGDGYLTEVVNVTVTGAGFDIAPNLSVNSPPNTSLIGPINHANISSAEFMCAANDLDSNLESISLYGSWNGWHLNETKSVFGSSNSSNFTKMIDEGTYQWTCLVNDTFNIGRFASENRTFTLDFTPPNVSNVAVNLSSRVCGVTNNIRVNCTVDDNLSGLMEVLISVNGPLGNQNYSTQLDSGAYYADIPLDYLGIWEFSCIATDFSGNVAYNYSNVIRTFNESTPDLSLTFDDIYFSKNNPVEHENILVSANITNEGCGQPDTDFIVSFYNGDPDLGAIQIGDNRTLNMGIEDYVSTNVSFSASIGLNNVFVVLDLLNNITEINETNNNANSNITVRAWNDYYGNISISAILANPNYYNFSLWTNITSTQGNIFISDTENQVSWNSLMAIGKDLSDQDTSDDFSEIDLFLNMTYLYDSVSNMFTSNGNTPRDTSDFQVYKRNISSVPIINSTNNTNFVTGILWDSSDDTDGEYSAADKEDIVFVTKVNPKSVGFYGTYDYEIKIPSRLREYNDTDTTDVYIYFEIN